MQLTGLSCLELPVSLMFEAVQVSSSSPSHDTPHFQILRLSLDMKSQSYLHVWTDELANSGEDVDKFLTLLIYLIELIELSAQSHQFQ